MIKSKGGVNLKQTRIITEAAIFLAVYSVLLAFTLFIPIFSIVTMFFLASPFIILIMRHGLKATIPMLFGSLIISIFLGPILALPITLMFAGTGLIMGYFYLKRQPMLALTGGTIAFLISFVINYVVSIAFFGMDVFGELLEEMKTSMNQAFDLFSTFGQEVPADIIDEMNSQLELLSYILPSILVVSAFIFAIITHLTNRLILKRLKLDFGSLKPFKDWTLPKSMLWYYLAAIILGFLDLQEGSFMYIALLNMIFVLQLLLLLQGFSFIFYYRHVKQLSKGIPILVIITSMILPLLQDLIRILGIIDLGFDLRNRLKK